MTLNAVVVCTGSDPSSIPLVLLHGFTQNTRCWGGFDESLAGLSARRTIVAVDAPGHGRSAHDDVDLVETADLIVERLEDLGITKAVYVGYSMGGRTGLHLAVYRPNRVAGLVLIGASPGLADGGERRIRRLADERLAEQLESESLEDFLDRWLAKPLFAGLSTEAMARDARLSNRPEGLAASLRHCGTGAQENLWPRLVQVRCPVLLVHGSDDPKFERIAGRMAVELDRRSPGAQLRAEVASVDGTHAVHLQRPPEVASVVASFLDANGL